MSFNHNVLFGTITAPTKVNLNLRLTGKRADGYHLLDSVVVFAAFGDQITLAPLLEPSGAPGIDHIETNGPFAGLVPANGTQNLCMRAIERYREQCPSLPPLSLYLEKNIPVGAGLGGGSADAAAILRQLNRAADKPLSQDALITMAAALGADVPVCLHDGAQFMTGIGEIVTPLILQSDHGQPDHVQPDHGQPTAPILLANPNIPLLTGSVFQTYTAQQTGFSPALTHSDLDGLSAEQMVRLGNDLTPAALTHVPKVGGLITDITQYDGALVAAMSGSGASCFGLFVSAVSCRRAAEDLRAKGHWAVASHIL